MKIKKIIENIYKIPGNATLREIYSEVNDQRLFVEPLSMSQTIEDFILEGGIGYNSLHFGRFGRKVCKIKAVYNGKTFEYGLPFTTLYATGYPLHRIIEGSRTNTFIKNFERIEYITAPLKKKDDVKVLWKESEYKIFTLPPSAHNLFYINSYGAELFGLKNEGFCMTLPKEFKEDEWKLLDENIWDNRFLLDKVDGNKNIMKIFTQQSNIHIIYEKFKTKLKKNIKNNLFLVLYTRLGILLIITGDKNEMDEIWNEVKESKLTYRLS